MFKLFNGSEFFLAKASALIVYFAALIAPMRATMAALLILVICDFLTGIYKVVKFKGWEAVKSAKMGKSITKLVMYYLAIVAGLACEIITPGIPFTKVATGFVAVVELKSIYENVGAITGVNIWVAVREYLDKYRTTNKEPEKKENEEN